MEPAFARQTLRRPARGLEAGGRRFAALLLFLALAVGCHRATAPAVLAKLRIGLGADSLSLSPDGSLAAVACRRSNDVWVLRLPGGELASRLDTLPKPRAVQFHPSGDSYFVAEGLSTVAQVRLSDLRVARRFRPRWRVTRLVLGPSGDRLFGGHAGVPLLGLYRLKDMHLETSIAVGGEVMEVAFRNGEALVLTRQADGLIELSLTDMSVRAAALAGPDPRAMALSGDRSIAWVACHGRAGEAVNLSLPTPTPDSGALSPLSGTALDQADDSDSDVDAGDADADATDSGDDSDDDDQAYDEAELHRFDGGGLACIRLGDVRRVDYLEVPGGPVALQLSPSGGEVAVACEDGQLRFVDLADRRVDQSLDLGGRPGAMAADPDGKDLLVALADEKALLRIRPGADWR